MPLEDLVNLNGPLAETLPQLDPSTIQHSHEIMTARRTDEALRDQWFWTADFPLYRVEKREAVLYLATRENNLIFKNVEEAARQLISSQNYRPRQEDIEAVVKGEGTLRFQLSDLDLKKDGDEWSYFEINTEKYDSLNPSQRAFAERVYGQGDDFIQNMQMLNGKIKTTRIYVLNPDYIKNKVTRDSAIARASRLDGFGVGSWLRADGGWVVDPDVALRGVRLKSAEGAPQKSDPVADAYETLLNNPAKALELMIPERAVGLSKLLTAYYSIPQKQ